MATTHGGQEIGGLDVRLLGELVVCRDGVQLTLGGRQQRSVLALLVLARGDIVPGERLIDDLWPGRSPASATSTLHSYVSRLRSALDSGGQATRGQAAGDQVRGAGPGEDGRVAVIERQGPGYRLRLAPDAVDAWRFEHRLAEASHGPPEARVARLSDALELWRGPALVDFVGQSWADTEATRLDGLREVAREQLLAARLDLGHSAVLVPELERLLAEDPLREERWRLLALALYRSSRQADALAAIRRARQHLSDELGVDPGPALRQLEADVLSQSSSIDPVGLSAVASAPSGAPPGEDRSVPVRGLGSPPSAPGSTSRTGAAAHGSEPDAPTAWSSAVPAAARPADPLVDRDAELAELARALDDALDGRGGLVVLEGPAGIGKTRLLTEARRLAADRGVTVTGARGSQLERGYGFGAVRQLLEPLLHSGPDLARPDGPAAAAAAVFDADLAHPGQPHAEPAGSPGAVADSFAVLNGLHWLLARAASSGPLLLAVDDVQWCDTSSLRFLAFALRRLDQLPVLVVATLRTGEPHADEDLLAEIVADPAALVVRPRPLSDAAAGDLVRSRLGASAAPSFVAACHRTTGGNPLLLRQLLRALESDRVPPDAAHADTVTAIGSRAISSQLLLRLRRLPPAAAAVARAVAVLGDGAALPAVSALAQLAEPETVAAVEALSRAEVLSDSHPLGFVHPLVAEAVYRDLPPGQREAAHERAARIVHAAGGSDEQIAAHLLLSPARGDAWVVEVLRRAADRARQRGAPEAAATYLSRAVDEPPPADDVVAMLVALSQVAGLSDGGLALRALERAYELATDPAQRAEVAMMLAGILIFLGPQGAATRFALRAAETIPADMVDVQEALVAVGRAAGWIHHLPTDRWLGQEPLPISGAGLGSRVLAIEQAWELCVRGVDRERAIELAHFALDDAEYVETDHDMFHDLANIALMVAGEDTERFWTDALARLHARGEALAVGVYLWHGVARWRRGELREAYQSLLTGRHQTEDWGSDTVGVPYCDAFLVLVSLDLGDVAGARSRLEEALPQKGIGDGRRLLREAEAAVLLAEGRFEEALAAVDRVLRDQSGLANPAWYGGRSLRAEILCALDRRPEAVELLRQEVAAARRWGEPESTGRLLCRLSGAMTGGGAVGAAAAAAGSERAAVGGAAAAAGPERAAVGGAAAAAGPERAAVEAAAREAVELLENGSARLERGRARAALAAATPDDAERATLLLGALRDADDCHALALRRDVAAALSGLGVAVPPAPSPGETLTELERRCLGLVAAGVDVPEIARRLFVTERTIEAALASAHQLLETSAGSGLAGAGAGRR